MRKWVFVIVMGLIFISSSLFASGPILGGPKGGSSKPTALPWAVPPPLVKSLLPPDCDIIKLGNGKNTLTTRFEESNTKSESGRLGKMNHR